MNNAGRAAGPWSYPAGGEPAVAAVTAAAAGYTSSFVADMIADYSTDDLFEMVWEQGGGASGSSAMQPAASRLCSPRFNKPPPPAAAEEVRFDPPSEAEMAAWLCAIVKGEEITAFNDDGGGRQQTAADGRRDVPAAAKGSSDGTSTMTDTKEKLPISEGTSTKQEMRKPGAGGSSRRSHHGEAHSLTEKRRRHKINERLRTLQQLVPGCDNSNQTSTLDKTIQYMKSLQHQVHVMSAGSIHPPPPLPPPPPPPPAAAYPFVPPQYVPPGAPVAVPMPTAAMVLGASSPAMVPFGAMVQLPHQYPLMMPAAPASLYPAAAPPTPMEPAAVPGGAGSSASRRQAGSSSRKGKGSSSRDLRQQHY